MGVVMKKIIVSVLGEDRPGIVHAVSEVLSSLGCNILEVSQTILQTEFAAMFITSMPESLSQEEVRSRLVTDLEPRGLTVAIRGFNHTHPFVNGAGEPFVITVHGEDQLGMIAAFSGVIAGFGVNIVNLKAISRKDEPNQVVIVFEVDVPPDVDGLAFREALRYKAEDCGLAVSVQHRNIFEAIHRL